MNRSALTAALLGGAFVIATCAPSNATAQTPPQKYGWDAAGARVSCMANDVGDAFRGNFTNIAMPDVLQRWFSIKSLSAGQVSRCPGAEITGSLVLK